MKNIKFTIIYHHKTIACYMQSFEKDLNLGTLVSFDHFCTPKHYISLPTQIITYINIAFECGSNLCAIV